MVTQPPRGSARGLCTRSGTRRTQSQAWVPARGQNCQKAADPWTRAAVLVRAAGQGLTDVSRIWSPRSECHPGRFLPRRLFLACGFSPCPHVAFPLGAVETALVSHSFFIPPAMPHGLRGLSSPTRDGTRALGPESTEAQPRDRQATVSCPLLMKPSGRGVRASRLISAGA